MAEARDIEFKDPAARLAETAPGELKGEKMVLNVGPSHPATHGVLRIVVELDGEIITKCRPDIGYLHTGIEKEFEVKTYAQAVTLTDRVDYLAPLSNNLGYALAVEKLLGLEIPPKAQWMRVMLVETGYNEGESLEKLKDEPGVEAIVPTLFLAAQFITERGHQDAS